MRHRVAVASLLLASACGRHPAPTTAPSPLTGRLPAIPVAGDSLRLSVVYPAPGAVLDVRDSTFLFGSAGTGAATLKVNGQSVPVAPNGAWLAWVPVPGDSLVQFDLQAIAGADTVRQVHTVRRPARFMPPASGPWVDAGSLVPRGRLWVAPDEAVTLALRAVEGATVHLVLPDGRRVPLVAEGRPEEVPAAVLAFDRAEDGTRPRVRRDRYAGTLRGVAIGDPGVPLSRGADAPSPAAQPARPPLASVEVVLGTDTVRAPWPLELSLLDSLPVVVELDDDVAGIGTTDSVTVGRAAPAATYHWFFPTGTRATLAERRNGSARLRLSSQADAWVAADELRRLPAGTPAPRGMLGSITVRPAPDRLRVRLPLGTRVPYQVLEDGHTLALVLESTVGDPNWIRHGSPDPLLEQVTWRQETRDRVRVTVHLTEPVWGWRARWQGGDLLLEVRRPPRLDARHPLRGRRIVLDAGHPPAGATGPTGLTEAEANLGVTLELERLLREAGAEPILTRRDAAPLGLQERVDFADSVDAELLVSVHNNALPDGLNPFVNSGTSVFFFQPHSAPLAAAVQAALVRRLGLRDLGFARGDLALVRPTWMPAILTEGLFMMLPAHEAALRHPDGRRAYAEGVRDGLRDFLAARARAQVR